MIAPPSIWRERWKVWLPVAVACATAIALLVLYVVAYAERVPLLNERLAAERQRVYHARLTGQPAPWTEDPIVAEYRFTNAYRAADRVSQDLLRVIYNGPQAASDVLLRTLLFRFFNKPQTWNALEA